MSRKTVREVTNEPPNPGAFLDKVEPADGKTTKTDPIAGAAAPSGTVDPPVKDRDSDPQSGPVHSNIEEEKPMLIDPDWPTRNGKPIPQRGWPAIVEAIVSLSSTSTPPEMNTADREIYQANAEAATKAAEANAKAALRAAEAMAAAKADMERFGSWEVRIGQVFNTVRYVSDTGEKMEWQPLAAVFSFHNTKGGSGKSTDAVLFANRIGDLTKQDILFVPVASNSGSAHNKAGVAAEDTLVLEELEKLLKKETTDGKVPANANAIKGALRKNEHGVYVIAQERLDDNFGASRLRWVIEQLKPIFKIIVLDGSNNPPSTGGPYVDQGGNVEYEAAKLSDVSFFALNPTIPDSWYDVGSTMDEITQIQDEEKLARSIVVVNGDQPESHDKWARFAEFNVDRDTGRLYGRRAFPFRVTARTDGDKPKGKLLIIPPEKSIVGNTKLEYSEMSEAGQWVITEMVMEGMERAAANQNVDLSTLDIILRLKESRFYFDPDSLPVPDERADSERNTPADTCQPETI